MIVNLSEVLVLATHYPERVGTIYLSIYLSIYLNNIRVSFNRLRFENIGEQENKVFLV